LDTQHFAITPELADRAAGVIVASAVGDALGAAYEFGGPVAPLEVEMGEGVLTRRHAGAWTDDTDMALCVLETLAEGRDLCEPAGLEALSARFLDWLHDGPDDIGGQTARALGHATSPADLPSAARATQAAHPNACGNGSLMRTGPVALGYVGSPMALMRAAEAVSSLTHPHLDAVAVCQVWSLAIAEAVRRGGSPTEIMYRSEIVLIDINGVPATTILREAEMADPSQLRDNGGAVNAMRAAWWAISSTSHLSGPAHVEAGLRAAVSLGGDTDTVAAIAGSLLGASYGASALPYRWRERLWGYPYYLTEGDLTRLAIRALRRGDADSSSWPVSADLREYYRTQWSAPHISVRSPLHPRLSLGTVMALDPATQDAVISLCRIGSSQRVGDHYEAWLIDGPENLHAPFVLEDVADTMERWLADREVFVHCVRAESRTPTAYGAWLVRHRGFSVESALAAAREILPNANPAPAMLDALSKVRPASRTSS
jgi:ADP-ribosylglycohydrolase